ncbi:hypothetical protein [Dysgonomonas sp. 25]|uniref:hypothetical protein n=1 Tax=Dysgonomonas sp. 25 TaxID=2302933 RepID=UPI0013D2C09A|nr:hypothetical protein [Dysgonomonas sp. 25]NDV67283.1 hypothetical protein [Dysgonomonas sp. 25]
MKNKIKLLYNPFEQVAGWKAFLMGLPIIIGSVLIAYTQDQYFSGVFNIRYIKDLVLGQAFLYQAISLLVLVMIMYGFGLIFSKGIRFQDVLGTVTLARYPYFFAAFTGFFLNTEATIEITNQVLAGNYQEVMKPLIIMTVVGGILCVILVWYIALLYNAFRISTGLKGAKCIILFILSLLLTDVISLILKCLLF